MKIIVYVAGPYTLGDVAINVSNMIKICNSLWSMGFIPYCPLLTHFWHLITPHPYEDWIEYDKIWVEKCDCLFRMPGKSSGADGEVVQMLALNRPIFFTLEEAETFLQENENGSKETNNTEAPEIGSNNQAPESTSGEGGNDSTGKEL